MRIAPMAARQPEVTRMKRTRVATWLAMVIGVGGALACGGTDGGPKTGQTSQRDTVTCTEPEPTCTDGDGNPIQDYCTADGAWTGCDPSADPSPCPDRT